LRGAPVADSIEGGEHLGPELAGLLEHGTHRILVEATVDAACDQAGQINGRLERGENVVYRCLVGHREYLGALCRRRGQVRSSSRLGATPCPAKVSNER